jgi:hypothetical protein
MSILVLVMGLPGTGKTSVAKKISQRIDAKKIDNDKVKRKIVPKLLGSKFEWYLKTRRRFPFYTRKKVYEAMLFETKNHLNKNKNVVCTGSFYSKKLREIFYDFLISQNIEFYIVNVVCPENILKKRIAKRQIRAKKEEIIATWDIYKKEKSLWQPIEEKHVIIDSSKDINEQVDKFLKQINQ